MPSLQLLRKLSAKLNADEQFLATGVEQVKQDPPELVEAEVERRLAGGRRDPSAGAHGPPGGLDDPVARARVLWEHSRALAAGGDGRGAARFTRDALALLDFADDRRLAST